MRRWETLTALGAVIVASAAALPIPGRVELAIAAIVAVLVVGGSILTRSLAQRARPGETDAARRARRIREQRRRR